MKEDSLPQSGWEWERGFLRGATLYDAEPRTVIFAPGRIEGSWSLCWVAPGERAPVGFAPGVDPSRLSAERCTVVSDGAGHRLRMVEHLLSVLAFWNGPGVIALLDGDALPALDGSAWGWYRALNALPGAAWRWQSYPVDLRQRWEWEGGFLEVESAERFEASLEWSAGGLTQQASLKEPPAGEEEKIDEVMKLLWNARTFISREELEAARAAGLFSPQPGQGVEWRSNGSATPEILEGGALRFPAEFAWHKMTDLVGDLALAGYGLPRLKITARNSGHFWNHKLLSAIAHSLSNSRQERH